VVQHKGWRVACRDDLDTIFIQNRQISVAAGHPASHWRCSKGLASCTQGRLVQKQSTSESKTTLDEGPVLFERMILFPWKLESTCTIFSPCLPGQLVRQQIAMLKMELTLEFYGAHCAPTISYVFKK
jgi:hypothetical protein